LVALAHRDADPFHRYNGRMDRWFRKFAQATAEVVGHSRAFFFAAFVVAVWGLTGPIFHFSDTVAARYQHRDHDRDILDGVSHSEHPNRDAHAVHLKLDELIRANKGARNALLGLEAMSDEELARLQIEFEQLRDEVAQHRARSAGAEATAHAGKR